METLPPCARRARGLARVARASLPLVLAPVLGATAQALQAQALVARYSLDELNGPTAHDSSSSSHDGRYTPGVQLGLPGANGNTNSAARFHASQSAQASIQEHLGLPLLRGNVSLSAWVKPESDDELMGIFGAHQFGWWAARTPTGLRFHVRFVQDFVQDCDVPVGQWSHVAFVFDETYDVTFYVNGERIGSQPGIWPAYTSGPEWSVGSIDGATGFWNGLLDDVQVYVGALTDAEVSWLHANPGAARDLMVGTPFCFGDGRGTPCPCFNYGASEGGCANSTGAGARLTTRGSNEVSLDDLRCSASQLPAGQPALLFSATGAANSGLGAVFGDGLRCVDGSVRRLGVRQADGVGEVSWPQGLRAIGGWSAGDTRQFQAWYRDSNGPCGLGFNLTQAIRVHFVP